MATDAWLKILEHKWYLSEKLGRDVGVKVACLDFIENNDLAPDPSMNEDRVHILKELGAQMVERSAWDTISETQPPKQNHQQQDHPSSNGDGIGSKAW